MTPILEKLNQAFLVPQPGQLGTVPIIFGSVQMGPYRDPRKKREKKVQRRNTPNKNTQKKHTKQTKKNKTSRQSADLRDKHLCRHATQSKTPKQRKEGMYV